MIKIKQVIKVNKRVIDVMWEFTNLERRAELPTFRSLILLASVLSRVQTESPLIITKYRYCLAIPHLAASGLWLALPSLG